MRLSFITPTKIFPVYYGVRCLTEMYLRENGKKGIGDIKYKPLFIRIWLLKVSRRMGWQLEGHRDF